MRYLPIHVDVQGHTCVVVGGGEVAARKVALLQRAGARVTIVAPDLCVSLAAKLGDACLEWQGQTFSGDCLRGARLVIAATDDANVNESVAREASALGLLVNVVDNPGHCSFIMPALVDRSPIVLSVSSEGTAPVLATRLRRRLEANLPPAVATLARFMGEHRGEVKAVLPDGPSRREFWTRFLDSHLPALLETDPPAAEAAFRTLLAGSAIAAPRVARLDLSSPDPLDLTLRALALLGEAERIVHAPEVPQAVLEYARRDAEFIAAGELIPQAADALPGLTLYLGCAWMSASV